MPQISSNWCQVCSGLKVGVDVYTARRLIYYLPQYQLGSRCGLVSFSFAGHYSYLSAYTWRRQSRTWLATRTGAAWEHADVTNKLSVSAYTRTPIRITRRCFMYNTTMLLRPPFLQHTSLIHSLYMPAASWLARVNHRSSVCDFWF